MKTRRDSKDVHFVQLNDGSCFADLQVVVADGVLSADLLKKITAGACVRFDGDLVSSPASGQRVELNASSVEIYGEADAAAYPMQKKRRVV